MSHLDSIEKKPNRLPSVFTGTTGRGTATIQVPSQMHINLSLNEILIIARKENASDVHLLPKKPVIFRKFGQLKNMTQEVLSSDQIRAMLTKALPEEVIADFDITGDGEYVHTVAGYGRFRMALMKQFNGWDLTVRLIPMDVHGFKNTKLPSSCVGLTQWAQGLVLISGPAGCGKTTTLAMLVDMINQTRHDHIITIEQPIEIVYEPKLCQITQREINIHTHSQAKALRAALREDPDILVVSELRDLETVQLAISAAETGHLVFGTMNTVNAAQTVSRLIDSFPAEEQPIIRNMVSESLRGIICQQLVPRADGHGVVVAYEILIVTPSIANLIRQGNITQMNNAITTGKPFGMISMEYSLLDLVKSESISNEEACLRATNPVTMMQLIASET